MISTNWNDSFFSPDRAILVAIRYYNDIVCVLDTFCGCLLFLVMKIFTNLTTHETHSLIWMFFLGFFFFAIFIFASHTSFVSLSQSAHGVTHSKFAQEYTVSSWKKLKKSQNHNLIVKLVHIVYTFTYTIHVIFIEN